MSLVARFHGKEHHTHCSSSTPTQRPRVYHPPTSGFRSARLLAEAWLLQVSQVCSLTAGLPGDNWSPSGRASWSPPPLGAKSTTDPLARTNPLHVEVDRTCLPRQPLAVTSAKGLSQLLHWRPRAPGRQGHCPLWGAHEREVEPTG